METGTARDNSRPALRATEPTQDSSSLVTVAVADSAVSTTIAAVAIVAVATTVAATTVIATTTIAVSAIAVAIVHGPTIAIAAVHVAAVAGLGIGIAQREAEHGGEHCDREKFSKHHQHSMGGTRLAARSGPDFL